MSEVGQSAPQQAEDDDPVIVRSRDAREIMDRRRAKQREERNEQQ